MKVVYMNEIDELFEEVVYRRKFDSLEELEGYIEEKAKYGLVFNWNRTLKEAWIEVDRKTFKELEKEEL